nr:unnamed protein product [Digitaria exilis]
MIVFQLVRRLVEQPHGPQNVSALETRAEHDVPGDGVLVGHRPERPPGAVVVAALGVHVEDRVAEHHVLAHAAPQHPPVHAPAGLHVAQPRAAPEDAREDEGVGRGGAAVAQHLRERAHAVRPEMIAVHAGRLLVDVPSNALRASWKPRAPTKQGWPQPLARSWGAPEEAAPVFLPRR